MSRILKWILILFVGLPLGLFLLAWLALALTPQQKIRDYAAGELGQKLNRQLVIGTVHLGLRGLGIDELQLSEIPNFKAGTFMDAKGLHLGWGLRTLWEGLNIRRKCLTRSNGHFTIDEFHNPHYSAHQFSMEWSLSDMDPTWSHVSGWAKLSQGAGVLQNVDQMMATSPSAKMALTPVLALMNLERTGFLKLGLPDLRYWPIHTITGDYTFTDGRITINHFMIDSAQLGMNTTGSMQLATGKLLLDVELHSPERTMLGVMDAKLRISGTTSNPKVDLENLKKRAFKATITNLMQNPESVKKNVDQAIKNLFH